MPVEFIDWFYQLTGHSSAHAWQVGLAAETNCRSRVVRIPTGFGKTHGALAVWSYFRICRSDGSWPRRLVWCLPMRSLVEQTVETATQMFSQLPECIRPNIHALMGGTDCGPWHLYPERPTVLIGTQDMLLSRALNRGYASSRARWPVEFGLLNQDALWVMDEVQLMDVGLTTASHLQVFRQQDASKQLSPAFTWWMSATLQPEWLATVDTEPYLPEWLHAPCVIEPAQRQGPLWSVSKELARATVPANNPDEFAALILSNHDQNSDGRWGKLTLVVCNTVQRAGETLEALRRKGRTDGLELAHSRFRGAERSLWRAAFLARDSCAPGVDRIIIATQVVEAGVDLSAACLITELAPWPSLVQRFGRCARYGGTGRVVVVDRVLDGRSSLPYTPEELEVAGDSLLALQDVGIANLEAFEAGLSPERRSRLYPFEPSQLLLRREFDELFDTTPDLSGADLDISRFIRTGEERDLNVFWDAVAREEAPDPKRLPQAAELCAVPFLAARDWLCGPASKNQTRSALLKGMRAWVWDWLDGKWIVATRTLLLPGRVVCVAADCGGYDTALGFAARSTNAVPVVSSRSLSSTPELIDSADAQEDNEDLSYSAWKTIADHSREVAELAAQLTALLGLPAELRPLFTIAATWHDAGKAHPAFQGSIRAESRPPRLDLAKAPNTAWVSRSRMYEYADATDQRCGFRHELASALALFAALEVFAPTHAALLGSWGEVLAAMGQQPPASPAEPQSSVSIQELIKLTPAEFDLVVYLVASHHGKVRLSLQAGPKDQEYIDRDGRGLPIRGVREADCLPAFELLPGLSALPELSLTLEPAAMGLSFRTGVSWQERCALLLQRYGPAGLAYLEAIFRAADARASQFNTVDPVFATRSRS